MPNFTHTVHVGLRPYDYLLEEITQHERFNEAIDREAAKYMTPIGLLVNITFLYVVARVQAMRTTVNLFLCNLAVADAGILATCLASLLWQTASIWRSVIVVSLANVSSVASYFFVTALAFERYSAICRPLAFRSVAGRGRVFRITGGLWVAAIVEGFALTAAFLWGGDVGSETTNVLVMVHYTVGLVTNAYMYGCIIKRLRHQPQITSSGDHRRRRRRVVLMIVLNTAVFFALNATSIIEVMLVAVIAWSNLSESSLMKLKHAWIDLVPVVFVLTLLNSSVNPLVYSGLNPDYRRALVEAFSFPGPERCCCRRPEAAQRQSQQIEMQAM